MKFLAGFLTASVLWGGVFALYVTGVIGPNTPEETPMVQGPADSEDQNASQKPRKRRRRTLTKDGRPVQGGANDTGDDDIGWDDPREMDFAAGEQQLSGSAIEAGFDSVMPRIRRCLILVPSEGDVKGRLLFGMRVGGDGKVKAVNLTGPSVVTGGESGGCLRDAGRSIQFPKFDGPEMVFKYPIDLQ